MNGGPRLSIVIAAGHAGSNLAPILLAVTRPTSGQGLSPLPVPVEVIVVAAGPLDCDAARSAAAAFPDVRVLEARPGALIPEMWRDGLCAARGEFVATLTAHCIPDPSWLQCAAGLCFAPQEAAVGGYFANADGADARAWAIYLLRYAEFTRPLDRASVTHVAADNAVYRRASILACVDLLPQGFWEPRYHRRFLDSGQRMRLEAGLRVVHSNRYGGREFAAQRRAHGRRFGYDRAASLGGGWRVVYALALPVVPALLFAKVVLRSLRSGALGTAPPATLPWLAFFVVHWSAGEVLGFLRGLRRT